MLTALHWHMSICMIKNCCRKLLNVQSSSRENDNKIACILWSGGFSDFTAKFGSNLMVLAPKPGGEGLNTLRRIPKPTHFVGKLLPGSRQNLYYVDSVGSLSHVGNPVLLKSFGKLYHCGGVCCQTLLFWESPAH